MMLALSRRELRPRAPRPFRHTVIDYPLRDAIADGVVKHPVLERVQVTGKDGAASEAVLANQPAGRPAQVGAHEPVLAR